MIQMALGRRKNQRGEGGAKISFKSDTSRPSAGPGHSDCCHQCWSLFCTVEVRAFRCQPASNVHDLVVHVSKLSSSESFSFWRAARLGPTAHHCFSRVREMTSDRSSNGRHNTSYGPPLPRFVPVKRDGDSTKPSTHQRANDHVNEGSLHDVVYPAGKEKVAELASADQAQRVTYSRCALLYFTYGLIDFDFWRHSLSLEEETIKGRRAAVCQPRQRPSR